MMMIYVRFVLDQHAELDFYSASSLKQQSTDRHVAPLGQIIAVGFLYSAHYSPPGKAPSISECFQELR
jgi:hypothetical protein